VGREDFKTIKHIIAWNNPLYGFEFRAEVELDTGKAFYKTNMKTAPKFEECFFLVPQNRLAEFKPHLTILDKWQSLYGDDKIIMDGNYWSIKTIGECEREIRGFNQEPEDFDDFILKLENLLQKDFTYRKDGYTHTPRFAFIT